VHRAECGPQLHDRATHDWTLLVDRDEFLSLAVECTCTGKRNGQKLRVERSSLVHKTSLPQERSKCQAQRNQFMKQWAREPCPRARTMSPRARTRRNLLQGWHSTTEVAMSSHEPDEPPDVDRLFLADGLSLSSSLGLVAELEVSASLSEARWCGYPLQWW
jgi:hypothetical protein